MNPKKGHVCANYEVAAKELKETYANLLEAFAQLAL
jgi:hypothetical protein